MKRIVRKMLQPVWRWAISDDRLEKNEMVVRQRRGLEHNAESLTLAIHRASGGWIVETQFYIEKYDRTERNLHIVTEDKELGESLGHIVTIENLRR